MGRLVARLAKLARGAGHVFLVLSHERRRVVHFNVTAHPTAEWTAQQLREAFPFKADPAVSAARPRQNLRRRVRPPSQGHEH